MRAAFLSSSLCALCPHSVPPLLPLCALCSLSTFFGRSSSAGSTEPLANAGEADDADDAAPILSADQASSLTASVPVRAALRDPRLQEVLRHIDSAETRDAALRRLEVALKDPDFEQFSVAALREIGYSAADREK